MEIKPCTVDDILSPENAPLIDEYATESMIQGMPRPAPHYNLYKTLEQSGTLKCIGVYYNDVLVGFAVVITQILPHYGANVSATESFFIAEAYRKTGAGLKLLKAIEQHARDKGSAGLLISSPYGGRLEKVLPRSGYKPSNTVFFKNV